MLYPKIDVAVVGATGYGGAELIRLLSPHPAVHLKHTIAISNEGRKVGEIMPNLNGLVDLTIENLEPEQVEVDLVFLALPHRVSASIGARYQARGVRVIDLSGDWRLQDPSQYRKYYGSEHPFPERMGSYVYGLPELNRAEIAQSDCVASPGCFATATTLALLPFAQVGLLQGRVRVSAMTGSSGSGATHSAGTHHPIRAVNLKPYKPLAHQHTPEIEQTLMLAGAQDLTLDFVPVSAPLSRGILTTSFFEVDGSVGESTIVEAMEQTYRDEALVRVLSAGLPQVAAIKGSMFCDVAVTVGPLLSDGRRTVVAHSALDNIVKGGAGQAVQSMNIMIGVPETTGLLTATTWP